MYNNQTWTSFGEAPDVNQTQEGQDLSNGD
jgi:hypothetical protein